MYFESELVVVTEDTLLGLSVPSRLNRQAHLQSLQNRVNSSKPPVILWNLRPWNNFTVIHAVFADRLSFYQRMGFRVVIVLYDNVVSKLRRLPTVSHPEITEAVKNVRKWLFKAGLGVETTEIFLESEIWQLYSADILNRLTAMAHSSAVTQSQDIAKSSSISKTVDTLCELVYESVLQVDFVLTGAREANDVWNTVRLDYSEAASYSAPVVLAFPMIVTSQGSVAQTENEEISVFTSREDIESSILAANEKFLEQMFNLFLIPRERNRMILVDGRPVASYQLAKKAGISEASLRHVAAKQMADYFNGLRQVIA